MQDETPGTALARVDPSAEDSGGIDPGLAAALVLAIVEYPSFATACASCGVTGRSVKSMLQRGIQVGAPHSLASFARAFAKADANNAREHWNLMGQLLAKGQVGAARVILDLMARRWPMETDNDVMAMLSGGKRADNLRARLERPSSMLLAMLKSVLVAPNETWRTLLKQCGWLHTGVPRPDPEPENEAD